MHRIIIIQARKYTLNISYKTYLKYPEVRTPSVSLVTPLSREVVLGGLIWLPYEDPTENAPPSGVTPKTLEPLLPGDNDGLRICSALPLELPICNEVRDNVGLVSTENLSQPGTKLSTSLGLDIVPLLSAPGRCSDLFRLDFLTKLRRFHVFANLFSPRLVSQSGLAGL